MKHHSIIGIKQNQNKTERSRRSQQLSAVELMKKNSELYDRLIKVEAHFIELESKLFESSSRSGYAELRAGRADVRTVEAERRAGEAETRAAEAERRAGEAEDKAVEAERKAGEAETKVVEADRIARSADERCMRLEVKWQRITGMVKKVLRVLLYIPRVIKKLLRKIKNKTLHIANRFSSTKNEIIDEQVHIEAAEERDIPQAKSTEVSPRSTQIYQNLEHSVAQQRNQKECE